MPDDDATPDPGDGILETVDIDGVEVFASGGPYRGHGSEPGGDFFSREDVETLAADTQGFVDDRNMKSVLKIGHTATQEMAKTLGVGKDELPALGTQTNFRVNDAGKVVADWRQVPKKLAAQIAAGRWPSRSVELYRKTLEDGSKKLVIGATALLGADPPAVGNLADIEALHSEDVELVRAFALTVTDHAEMASGDVVWDPEQGMCYLKDQLCKAINPPQGMTPGLDPYYVSDVSAQGGSKYLGLVQSNTDYSTAYVVPFTLGDDGAVVGPSSDWQEAEQAWVAMADAPSIEACTHESGAKGFKATGGDVCHTHDGTAAGIGKAKQRAMSKAMKAYGATDDQLAARGLLLDSDEDDGEEQMSADTSIEMSTTDTKTLSDEQVTALAAAFGIEETDADKRCEAVVSKFAEHAPAAAPVEEEKPEVEETPAAPETDEGARAMAAAQLEVLTAKAERGDKAYAQLQSERHDRKIETAMREGRIDPAKKETWLAAFSENEDMAERMLADMPVNEDLVRVYGADEDSAGDGQMSDEAYASYAENILGVDAPVTYRRDR